MANDNFKESEKKFFERQLVVFTIGKEEFGVDISDVREIIKLEQITKVPNTDFYVDGIINLRGKIVVIVDFAKKIEMTPDARGNNTRVIITEIQGSTIGFVVNSCNEVLRLTGDKIEAAPKIITDKINADYIQGVGILENRLIILMDLARVMGETDMAKISGMTGADEQIGEKKKLLIVEDSSLMRGTLKGYIDNRKFNVIEAEDGEIGVSLFEKENPDVILLDVKLPKMSGVDVLRKIRETNQNVQVIMETSVYEDETKNECMKLGAKGYLKKPINKKELQDLLNEVYASK